jgi:lipopolysaccharide transport system permease protein
MRQDHDPNIGTVSQSGSLSSEAATVATEIQEVIGNAAMWTTEITSTHRYFPDLREIWVHRRLALVLAQRNIKVRYMQTLLGSIWIVVQPLLMTGILTVVFGLILSAPADGMPYALFAFTGTVVWAGFQRALNDTSVSLANSGNIVLKVYFPRILIPISAVLTSFFDLIPTYVVLLITAAILRHASGLSILLSPLFILLAFIMAFAIGLWVTVLDAAFRDVRLVVPSAMQVVFYITPIVYSQTAVPAGWRALYHLNPFLGVVVGFRWSVIAGAVPPGIFDLVWSVCFCGLLLGTGLMLFARIENYAVDRI